MRKQASLIGLLLIVMGTLLLLVCYFLHQTTNLWLLTGLALIIAGIVGYIQGVKHANDY